MRFHRVHGEPFGMRLVDDTRNMCRTYESVKKPEYAHSLSQKGSNVTAQSNALGKCENNLHPERVR